MKLTSKWFAIAIASLGTVILGGCMPGAPIPLASPSAAESGVLGTPTAEPEHIPVATSLIISGSGVAVLDETATVMVDIPFTTDGATAAAELAVALGAEPTETAMEGSPFCRLPYTEYNWGGFVLQSDRDIEDTGTPPAGFIAIAEEAITAGVAVYGPHNLQVGATLAEVLAADPGGVSRDYGNGLVYVALDVTGGSGVDVTGTQGIVSDEVLTVMLSPVYVFGDC